jgi:hypothetical protein
VLALQAQRDAVLVPEIRRAIKWLLSQQKPSGGWSPNGSVAECTSVTSIATLALLAVAPATLDSALSWVASQVYPDDFSIPLLLAKALNVPPAHAPGSVPWFPGTAGWVTPTALTALTLLRASGERNRPDLRTLALKCGAYLLGRRCIDDGWNHGGSKTRSEDATSYPETTGLALLALRAADINPPAASLTLARRFATHPESSEGFSWIQMALASPVPDPASLPPPRTTRDSALRLLSLAALEGQNPFLTAWS